MKNWAFFKDAIAIFALLLVAVFLWLPRFEGPIDLRWDAAVYYVLGTSLAEGKGYRLLNEPGDIEAIQYPPLLPAVIAVHQWVFGSHDLLVVGPGLRITWFVVFLIYSVLSYRLARQYLTSGFAFLSGLISQLSVSVCLASDRCVPEIPFACATMLSVILSRMKNRLTPLFAFLSAAAAYFLRSIGISLFGAWILESLLEKNYKQTLLRIALSVVAVLPWMLYVASVERQINYKNPVYAFQRADYFFYNVSYSRNIFTFKNPMDPDLGKASVTDIAGRLFQNISELPVILGEPVSIDRSSWHNTWRALREKFPIPWPAAYLYLLIPGILFLGGLILQFVKRQWLFSFYVVISLMLICLTPWREHTDRYVAPLVPFLALGLMQIVRFSIIRWHKLGWVLCGFVLLSVLTLEVFPLRFVYRNYLDPVSYRSKDGRIHNFRWFVYDQKFRALDRGLEWLGDHASSGAVAAASMPQWVYLRTGMKTIMPPFTRDPMEAFRLLSSVPVDTYVYDETDPIPHVYMANPILNSEHWEPIYSDTDSGVRIYRRRTGF